MILRLTVPAGTKPGNQEITSLVGTSHFGPVSDRATAISTAVSNVDTPQISFTKTDTPDPVVAGNAITYTLNYENTGSRNATSVVILDSIPANTTFVAGSASAESGVSIDFSTDNGFTWGAEPADPTTVTDIRWTVGIVPKNSGPLSAGFQVQTDIALPAGSLLNNSAIIQSNKFPDITATASTTVLAAVVFTDSTKTVTPLLAGPGDMLRLGGLVPVNLPGRQQTALRLRRDDSRTQQAGPTIRRAVPCAWSSAPIARMYFRPCPQPRRNTSDRESAESHTRNTTS